jgi:hypothetical protein
VVPLSATFEINALPGASFASARHELLCEENAKAGRLEKNRAPRAHNFDTRARNDRLTNADEHAVSISKKRSAAETAVMHWKVTRQRQQSSL